MGKKRAKLAVGILKEAVRKDLRESGSPIFLWDYCMERRALICLATSKKLFQLQGSNPHTATFGTQADISNLCHFGWYEWVYYKDKLDKFPFQKECLGRCLGPAKNEGNVKANRILTQKSTVIPWLSICWLTLDKYSVLNKFELAQCGTKSNVFNHSSGLKNSRFALIFRYIPYIPVARTIILKAGTKKECVSFCSVRRNCL